MLLYLLSEDGGSSAAPLAVALTDRVLQAVGLDGWGGLRRRQLSVLVEGGPATARRLDGRRYVSKYATCP